jgi:polyisoprenoid-binding protein YceI
MAASGLGLRMVAFLVVGCGPLWALAKPSRFDMRDAVQRNLVQFVSDAVLEKTVGISNSLAGWLEIDPDRVGDGVKGEFEVDVRTFRTGIDLKDDQVRDKFLGGTEFPLATYSITRFVSASKPKLVEGQPITVKVEGTLSARGVSRPQPILLKLVYFRESEFTRQRLPGNLIKLSATFDVDISQFNVPIPDNQKVRVARFVQVTVDAVGTDRSPSMSVVNLEAGKPDPNRPDTAPPAPVPKPKDTRKP